VTIELFALFSMTFHDLCAPCKQHLMLEKWRNANSAKCKQWERPLDNNTLPLALLLLTDHGLRP